MPHGAAAAVRGAAWAGGSLADLGAGPFTTFFLVPLPQIRAGIYVQYFIDPTIAAVSAATIVAAGLTIVIVDMVIGLDFLSGSD